CNALSLYTPLLLSISSLSPYTTLFRSRAAAQRPSLAGLPGRGGSGPANLEGAGPQLSDDRQRSHPGHESTQSSVPQPGDFLCRSGGLRAAPSRRVVAKAAGSWRPPSGRATLPTTRSAAGSAPGSPPGTVGREPETSRDSRAAKDSIPRPGSSRL